VKTLEFMETSLLLQIIVGTIGLTFGISLNTVQDLLLIRIPDTVDTVVQQYGRAGRSEEGDGPAHGFFFATKAEVKAAEKQLAGKLEVHFIFYLPPSEPPPVQAGPSSKYSNRWTKDVHFFLWRSSVFMRSLIASIRTHLSRDHTLIVLPLTVQSHVSQSEKDLVFCPYPLPSGISLGPLNFPKPSQCTRAGKPTKAVNYATFEIPSVALCLQSLSIVTILLPCFFPARLSIH
jgi:hypothetical protein